MFGRTGRDERRVILFTMLDDVIDFFTAGAVGLLGWFFGGIDGFVKVLITFSIIDFITGLMAAYTKHELNSSVGFNGICRKISMFCLVGVAHIIDLYMLGDTAMLKTSVTLFYAVNEGISIFENVNVLGIPIPQFLKDRLFNLKEQITTQRNDKPTHRSKGAKESKGTLATSKGKQKQKLQESQGSESNATREAIIGHDIRNVMGFDLSGHEVIRHELYTVHNGGINNSSINSHVADNVVREDAREASDGNDDDEDADADTDSDEDDDNYDKCVRDIGVGANGAGE